MNQLPRLTVKELRNETLKFFNLEKGIAFTYVSMFKKPFETIKTYLGFDRKKFSNPLNYLLFGIAVYTIMFRLHPSFKSFVEFAQKANAKSLAPLEKLFDVSIIVPMNQAQEIYFSYQNIFYLISIPIMSIITFWLFKKKYNYAENLAINSFVFGTTIWTSVILSVVTLFLNSFIVIYIIMTISILLLIYLYHKIFQINWYKALGTMLLVYFITTIVGMFFQYGLAIYFSITAT
ncbi:MAG: DUF3667 domain-containing protein [Flavobacteriaceae bacterium]|nr:DUF3667 domain-containing protein [Flavobacteriaceae bacterium]